LTCPGLKCEKLYAIQTNANGKMSILYRVKLGGEWQRAWVPVSAIYDIEKGLKETQ
jgi:hypothetical protein